MADLTQIQFNGVTYNLIDDTAIHPSDVDTALSDTSENPVQNAVITDKINTMPQQGVYYLVNDGSIAADTTKPYYASRWITTNDNISSYFDGLTVAVKVPVAGNGTYGTVLSVNGLGEHPVIRNVSTMIGTTYGVGSMLVLTYDATATATAYINSNTASTITGVWKLSDYDSTIVYRLQQYYTTPRVNAGAGTLYRYEICFSKFDGSLVPANNQSNKATTYNKVLNDEPFDPFGNIYYYLSTATAAAGDPVGANILFRVYLADIRYSFNIDSGGAAGTTSLTTHDPVYIKCLYNKTTRMATLTQDLTSANYLERSGLVQSLPTADPNTELTGGEEYIYIYLGHTYSKYQVEMSVAHQVYHWSSYAETIEHFKGTDSGLKLAVEGNGDGTETYTAIFFN